MPESEPQPDGPRASRPIWPLSRLFGRAHSVATTTVLPDEPAAMHPASIHADFGTLQGGLVELRAASIRGLSHRGDGAHPRQDAFAWSSRGTRLCLAVADGVGSASHSHIGAQAAADTAIALLAAGVGSPRTLGTAVAARLEAEARVLSVDPAALATTLAAVVISVGKPNESWKVVAAEWGDSRVSVFSPSIVVAGHPAWRYVTEGDERLLANEVAALPLHRIPSSLGTTMLAPREVIAVVSDGIDVHLNPENSVGHGLAEAWTVPPSIAQFICDVDFERIGARDDRTALAVFRTGAAEVTP